MIPLQERYQPRAFSLFNLGFRPFFLLSALAAFILIPYWLHVYMGGHYAGLFTRSVIWHGHEMLFGFTLAVIAGFLLTAVKNWSNRQTLHRKPLALLVLLWLSARVLIVQPVIPPAWVAIIDLAFIPALMLALAVPLIKSANWRNLIMLVMLSLLLLANGWIYAAEFGWHSYGAQAGLKLGWGVVVTLIMLIGGRVIPFFTERGLNNGFKPVRHAAIERAVIPLALLWLACLVSQWQAGLIVLSLANAGLHLVRLSLWWQGDILKKPLLWILHLGYVFIPLGMLLLTLAQLQLVSESIALHAFTVGAIGCMTLGMMSRVTLGHTGRQLQINPLMAAGFTFMLGAALVRISLTLLPFGYTGGLIVAGGLWSIAWLIFMLNFAWPLLRPRVDGLYG